MTSGVPSTLAMLLRVASRAICVIVIVSFAIFALDQTGEASSHQQAALDERTATNEPAKTPDAEHKSGVRETIDDAADALTSPFSGVTAGSSSAWVVHGVRTLLALLVYGFGLGYVARVIRVRV